MWLVALFLGGAQPPLFLPWSTEVWSIPIAVILVEFSVLSVGFWRHEQGAERQGLRPEGSAAAAHATWEATGPHLHLFS